MKSVTIILTSVLASAAIAQPHGHQHKALHHKRDSPPVVWETELAYVTETVDITTTIWVSAGFVAPSSSPSPVAPSPSTSSSAIIVASAMPAQFFEPATSPSVAPTPATTPTSVYVAPSPVSTYIPPTSSAAPDYVAPVVEIPSPAAASIPETSAAVVAPTSVATVVAPVVTSVAPASSAAPSSSSGSDFEGDMTHYDTGEGACGWTNVSTDKVVALSHLLMGEESNGNEYCGKIITITCKATGQTAQAKVVDKCMGCKMYDIDLSDGVFSSLADMGLGRTTATWHFN